MANDYDLIVIGAGSAGQAAASIGRAKGWRVLVVEKRDVGGTCPLRGCVPKKVLVAAAAVTDEMARAATHAIALSVPPALDWPALIARKQGFVDGVAASMEEDLERQGIDVRHARARLVARNAVEVDGKVYTAGKILVSVGSKPRALRIPGAEHLITSDDILDLATLPASIVFVGAGVIAMEFAHVLSRAGSRVTLLEVAQRALPFLDEDAVARLVEATRGLGVDVRTGVEVIEVRRDDSKLVVRFRHEGQEQSLEAEAAANGAGRVADLDDLDLEAAGIEHDGVRVKLDPFLRSVTNNDVFFAGDAIAATPQLSPVAGYEGRIAAHNMTHAENMQVPDYRSIPACVFTIPTLATVGISEPAAQREGIDARVKTSDMASWRSSRTHAESVAFAKVLVERGTDRILGAHLLGHGAAETIHAFAFAMKHGVTARELKETVYAYPTFHSDIRFLV